MAIRWSLSANCISLASLLFLSATVGTANAVEPVWVARCSDPKGQGVYIESGETTFKEDGIFPQTYVLVFYDADTEDNLAVKIIGEGRNNLNEEGSYRIYGDKDDPILEATILYKRSTWVYSLFTQSKVLFMHSTKTGILGTPTGHLFVAQCE